MRKSLILSPLLLASALMGCHRGHNNNPVDAAKNLVNAASDPKLFGTYESLDCTHQGDVISKALKTWGDVKGAREQYTFSAGSVTHRTVYYNRTDCSGSEVARTEEVGVLELNKDKKTEEDARYMDFIFNKVSTRGAGQDGEKNVNNRVHQIYRLEGDYLILGDLKQNGNRPEKLDYNNKFVKKGSQSGLSDQSWLSDDEDEYAEPDAEMVDADLADLDQ